VAAIAVEFTLSTVAETTLVFWILPAIPNTNAAMTAARITVMATIRITPMTGDTASSFFMNFIVNTSKLCPESGHDNVYHVIAYDTI
jgi:hypothetical protein